MTGTIRRNIHSAKEQSECRSSSDSDHCVQERLVLDAIQQYFQHEVPEVSYDDEDAFVDVLQQAGLTDG